MNRSITSIIGDLRLLHMYTTDRETFIASVLDLINEFQDFSDEEIMFASDEEFAEFLNNKVYNEIIVNKQLDVDSDE